MKLAEIKTIKTKRRNITFNNRRHIANESNIKEVRKAQRENGIIDLYNVLHVSRQFAKGPEVCHVHTLLLLLPIIFF